MWYDTKKAILEAYGKDWKNVRWLDKAIQRWFIVKNHWQYAFRRDVEQVEKSWQQVDISWLKEENEKLRREMEGLKKSGWEELKDHLKFFYEMDLARKAAMEEVIKSFASKYSDLWWEEAEKKALMFMKFTPNPLEEEEIEYVGGLNL